MAAQSDITIRRAEERDLPLVLEIENHSFTSVWTYDFFQHEIHNPFSHFCVLEENGGILAYIVFWIVAGEAHIANLAVDPLRRRKGYADILLQYAVVKSLENGANYLTLEVNEKNQPALTLYEKHGFRQVGKRNKYYEDRDDALVLRLSLNQ